MDKEKKEPISRWKLPSGILSLAVANDERSLVTGCLHGVYLTDSDTRKLHLVQATPAGFKELASATLLDGEQIWAPLALSDGVIFSRGSVWERVPLGRRSSAGATS